MTTLDAPTRTEHMPATDSEAAASRRTRLGAWTLEALRDLAYAAAVCAWAVAGFCIIVTGVSLTASLLVLVVGVVVWVGLVHVLRWTTWVDRGLAGWQRRAPVPTVYRRATEGGAVPYVRALTTDPQTWKDLAWVVLNSAVGFAYGLVVLTAAGLVITYVTMPAWYWAVSHPHTEYGITNLGLFTVDTLGEAAVTAMIGMALLPVALVLARLGASIHSRLAVQFLAPGQAPVATPGPRREVDPHA